MPKLVKELSLGNFGGNATDYGLAAGDINDDDRPELIMRQCPGIFASSHFHPAEMTPAMVALEDQALFYLTAMDLDGNVLWQVGEPWKLDRPYRSHAPRDVTRVCDIDGDGANEVVYLRNDGYWGRIVIADGATGKTKKERSLPQDNFSFIGIANFLGNPTPQEMLLKPYDRSSWGYGNPAMALNKDLEVVWPQKWYKGAGHPALIFDADGDGRDEALIGYNLVDDDGKILWTLDFPGHLDYAVAEDVDDDGEPEIVMSVGCGTGYGNMYGVLADVRGHILWKNRYMHCEEISIGKFRRDLPGKQIAWNMHWYDLYQGGIYCVGSDGAELWSLLDNGVGHTVNWSNDHGDDMIVYSRKPTAEKDFGYEPVLLDSYGKVVYKFPVPDTSVKDISTPDFPVCVRKYDYGAGYTVTIFDVDMDGKDEVLIHNRRKLYIFAES